MKEFWVLRSHCTYLPYSYDDDDDDDDDCGGGGGGDGDDAKVVQISFIRNCNDLVSDLYRPVKLCKIKLKSSVAPHPLAFK